ncbi:enolase, putative [Trypanosoma brucei brucei TREU927]|uniref:Enolase, putative n=1 Tax=Trypanosoma brucei brucei (strain 927/4 GUTat10.1) TaxID=185431 RepID=Q381E5_TRYB2|nr:enolase, putative [Trypanosoma brucei brucei TREU927]EAN80586.1 enolase, putative [Trypanosoma brucei brucei TREU927]
MESVSWKLYDNQHDLSGILTLAARSCVDSRALRPIEYLAAYFSTKCTGDEIRTLSAHVMFAPGGCRVLRIILRLLNGMEVQSSALLSASQELGDSLVEHTVDPAVIHEVLQESYFPRLVPCRACDQRQFDEILSRVAATPDLPNVGTAVVHALSVVASAAASRCTSTPAFQYLRNTFGLLTDVETFSMPQLCIDFFGPENVATARVALKSVLILPCMPNGTVSHEVMQKIFAAFNHFRKVHNAATRSDGSLVFSTFDNITDAINLADEVLRAVELRPQTDVCLGLRLAAPATRTQKEAKDGGEVFYSMFPGEQDITGSQLAEYVREQVQASANLVVYVEDTHCDVDTIGLRRLHATIGGTAVFSGYDLYRRSKYEKVEQGLDELWTSNVVLEASAIGSLSALCDNVRMVRRHEGCTIALAPQSLMHNVAFAVHLAVGVGARFLCVGGLMDVVQCEVVSQYLYVQDELEQSRLLLEEAPKPPCAVLPDAPTDTVPEIKRRLDKKKRKK